MLTAERTVLSPLCRTWYVFRRRTKPRWGMSCRARSTSPRRSAGLVLAPTLYTPSEAPHIDKHSIFWPGRDYTNRPNVNAVRRGSGGGRSLILSGHIDTVPVGAAAWTRDPFGGAIEGNRLYGRG